LQEEIRALSRETERLKAETAYKQQMLETQQAGIEHIGQKFETQFKVLAGNILEEKAKRFTEQQEQNLKTILDPLKQHINNFKQEFEAKFSNEAKERNSLAGEIKQMMTLNKVLSEQADNLTQALRGNVKQQGNWGEMILESILEYAGLQKNMQYFVQERNRNDEGAAIQPDVIVRYPDNRALVIDSKVSLLHYENYCSSTEKELQGNYLQLMVRSMKAHIDGLSSKAYHDVKDSLDFVIMFVPVEAAYITVMQADTHLWQYAYNKRVLLISPTNLITAMKLVDDMWQRDAINRDAHMIAEKAGKLYDKLVGFVENFDRVGEQINKAHATWAEAYGQLSKGRGNLISQAEQMKQYKAKTNKSLPHKLSEEGLAEDRQTIEDLPRGEAL